jgi:hypothetical protein
MSKSLKDMNQTELYDEAKRLDIKGRSKLKSKAQRSKLIAKIIEARKEAVYSGEEEMKMDEEGRTEPPSSRLDRLAEDNILEQALDELQEEMKSEPEREEENASERVARIMRENQPPPQAQQPERQLAPQAPVSGNLLTKGLVELARMKGASPAQLKALEVVSNKVQQAYGDKSYFKSGKWIEDIASNLLPAELKAVNWFQKAVGWYDDKDAEELDKIMDGNSDLSTLQQISVATRAITSLKGLSQLTQRVIDQGVDDITEGVQKANKIMKGEYRTEKDVRDEIDQMEIGEIEKKKSAQYAKEEELLELKGHKSTGKREFKAPAFSTRPTAGDYDPNLRLKSGKEMGTRDAIEAGIGGVSKVAKRLTGLRTREVSEMDMEGQLKQTNPKAYEQMKRDQKRYDEDTKRRHTIKSRKDKITDPQHIKLRKQLSDQIDNVLQKNKELRKNNDGLKDDQIEELVELRDWVGDTSIPINYENLNAIYLTTSNMARAIPELDERVRSDLTNYEASEESKLRARDDTEAPLNIASDQSLLEKGESQLDNMKNRIAMEEAIKEKKIDDFNREVIESRADVVSTGFVDTDNKGRATLRPRIVWGDTDRLLPDPTEVRENTREIDSMLMWGNTDIEKPFDNNDFLYQRRLQQERKRFDKTFTLPRTTFPAPNVPQYKVNKLPKYGGNDELMPESFIRLTNRTLIPVYPSDEEFLWHRDVREIPEKFARFEPEDSYTINQRAERKRMINVYPERTLQKSSSLNRKGQSGNNLALMKVKELFKSNMYN